MSGLDNQQHLFDLIRHFKHAFLITARGDGAMHARPLAIADLQKDGTAYFSTSINSPKIEDIEADPNVLITFQAGGKFATLNGVAEITRDRALIEALWSEAWKMWFPEGKDDPSLCILRVTSEQGEYWDNHGAKGITFAFEAVGAILQKKQPDENDPKRHAKVGL